MAHKITILRCITLTAGMALWAGTAFSQTPPTTLTNTFTLNAAIPEGNPSGLSDTETLNFVPEQLFSISNLQVTLNISGGFNGDYYAYLVHDDSFVVLLNRVGTTSGNPVGYADSGLTITLSAASANNIHTYQNQVNPAGGTLTGIWNVDGRNVDPSVVLDTSPVTTSLDSFIGDDPSGQWTLFLADLDYGEQGTLTSWGLVVTAVPEPGTFGLLALGLGGLAGMRWLRRRG